MSVMGVMHAPVDDVIAVIAMGYGIMPAIRAMHMIASHARRASRGRDHAHVHDVLVDVPVMHMVHVAVVKIVGMAVVVHAGVAAILAVLMRMARMMLLAAIGHDVLSCRFGHSENVFRAERYPAKPLPVRLRPW